MLTIVSKSAGYDYSSTQISIPRGLSKQLKRWGYDNIPACDVFKESDGSKGREFDNHVTVKYGLLTNSEKDVRKVVSGFGSFDIELGPVSRFAKPDKPFDVVKIEVLSTRLHELHKLIGDSLENEDEWPEYKPHSTLAYILKGTCRELSGADDFCGKKFRVHEIVFSPKVGEKVSIELD